MKHERTYYTCEGCGNNLPEEGHTEVRAEFTGYRDSTINDIRVWELCAQCWLDVFSILDREDHKRRQARITTSLFVGDDEDDPDDDWRPWDHG